jgi:beta-lactamase class A
MQVQQVIDEIIAATPRVRWSVAVTGRAVAAHAPDRRLRTASIGKILLLAEAARQFEAGTLDPDEMLARRPEVAVADSGLWQHLAVDALPAVDVAVLIAAASDNYATNVLLDRVGVAAVADLTRTLGLRDTSLYDFVRNRREPTHPPTLSTGSAGELAGLMDRIARGDLVSAAVSERLDRWLGLNTDLSMVAAGLHLDPLAHVAADRGLVLRNKTGTDDGIRADVGLLRTPGGVLCYAVLANWDAAAHDGTAEVMAGMRRLGAALAGDPLRR